MATRSRPLVLRSIAPLLVVAALAAACGGGESATSPTTDRTGSSTSSSSSAPPPTTPRPTAPPPTATEPDPTVPPTATPTGDAVVVRRGDRTRQVVALTFDAGSDRGSAAEILDILADEEVEATFGITGRWAEANPALVRRIAADGHQIVNHSDDHLSFTGGSTGTPALSRTERLDQLARADAAIQAAAGVTSVPWFRPPYGDEDASVRADIALAGYAYELLWTVDSHGWLGEPAADVVARCLGQAVPGAIYLFHVGAESSDAAALPAIIDGLRRLGYGFTTASGVR